MIVPNLLVIRAKDPWRAAEFYSAMGLRFETERHGSGPEHLACSMNGFLFEIYPQADGPATSSTRLGFTVDSLEDVIHAVEATNGRIVSAPAMTQWGRRAVVTDPEGHKIELVERAYVPAIRDDHGGLRL